MSRSWSSFLLLALFGWAAPQASPRVVRVLTYNIHHGEGMDGEFDFQRLARIIESTQADLVALQEVDQATQRASGVDELTELGRLTHLHPAFGKAMDFQGGAYGVGILSRWPLRQVENHPLPGSPDREPRTSLTVEVRINRRGPLFRFTSTHFDQGRDLGNRLAQASELNHRLLLDDGTPTILAGDFNSGAKTEVMQIFDGDWQNVSPPDPALLVPTARGRVDYVLVRPVTGWRVVDSQVVDAPIASDHRPLLVVLEWTGDSHVLVTRH